MFCSMFSGVDFYFFTFLAERSNLDLLTSWWLQHAIDLLSGSQKEKKNKQILGR